MTEAKKDTLVEQPLSEEQRAAVQRLLVLHYARGLVDAMKELADAFEKMEKETFQAEDIIQEMTYIMNAANDIVEDTKSD